MNKLDNNEKIRRISIAVAEWLCGTLEGSAGDSEDMNCAEALDTWLRVQKRNRETLFIGKFTCPSCNTFWGGLTLSDDSNRFHCPNCGSSHKIVSGNTPPVDLPSNIDKLKDLQLESTEIVEKIEALNNLLMKQHTE